MDNSTHNHEQDESLEDLRGQVHGRSVGEVVDNEAEDGGCSQKVIHRAIEPVARPAFQPRPDLRVQSSQVEEDASLFESHGPLSAGHARQGIKP